jgi:phosphatidylglycerophosphate synthase
MCVAKAMDGFEIWIDATSPESSLVVFGMALPERQIAAIAQLASGRRKQCDVARIVVEHPAGARPFVAPALVELLRVEFREVTGPYAERLARASAEAKATLLALPGDAILDSRVLGALLTGSDTRVAFGGEGEKRTALIRLAPQQPQPPGDDALAVAGALLASGAARELALASIGQHLRNLRRDLAAYAFRLRASELGEVERWLFWSNYKGSTDFLTRWVFPPFVWAAVRPLTRWRVHPNWITGLAVLLCIAAIPLWARGEWLLGFIAAYSMAVLDSVDGKVARLTYTTSLFGNILDHGTDLIHPPFWYAAWAWGLAGGPTGPSFELALWLFAIYIADRLIAPFFKRIAGKSIHGYAPVDVKMRTFISRRNVNLPVFTLALPLGFGHEAIVFVVAWQVVCLAFHAVRFVQMWQEKRVVAA